ncbi:MAG: PHP domain-containing protein [Halobacteriota archaeon]|nr:PHP domain-containing protein [Halobacteriota archaeon]
MPLRFDLHIHSSFSGDAHSSIGEIIRRAEEVRLDGIAITDHDEIKGAIAAERYVEENGLDMIIIPGTESTTSRGHLILLGIREAVPKLLAPEEVIKIAEDLDALVIAPHPFHHFRHGIGEVDGLGVDAIEVFNSRYITKGPNERAMLYAQEKGIPSVAGSDAHIADAVGFGVTEVEADCDIDSILKAIKDGHTGYSGQKTPLLTYINQISNGFIRRVIREPIVELNDKD